MENAKKTTVEVFYVTLNNNEILEVSTLEMNLDECFSGVQVGDRYIQSYEIFDNHSKATKHMQLLSEDTGIPCKYRRPA